MTEKGSPSEDVLAMIKSKEEAVRFRESYSKLIRHRVLFIIIATILLIITALYAITIGSYTITFTEVYENIWYWISGAEPPDITKYHIAAEVRLPRVLTAMLAGVGLAIAGTTMQGMLKNPLADPYTMGISSGAGFGAALALIVGFEIIAGGGIVINAFVFAVIPAVVILMMSKLHTASPTVMILCGIGMMYLFDALTQLFMISAHPEDMSAVYQWMVGSISGTDFSNVIVILVIVIAGSIVLQALSKQLNVMGLGDESAKALGINVENRRMLMMLVLTLMAAAIVSFTGIIGFVGLVSPHIARVFVGTDNRYLIPSSAIVGALLLVVADIVSRTIVAPNILPIGVVTSCIGGPLFLFLILKARKEAWA
ncbi:iron ABC transporter permease [Methanomassiliicoccales archaeon LGM-RCC1]|nr:iron ABC transporter permease [Methanomassiliicoccales archaeon LGM-RCC1]